MESTTHPAPKLALGVLVLLGSGPDHPPRRSA
jgi:hypothetical protein